MRTFSVVGRPGSCTSPSTPTPAAASCSHNRSPAASAPIVPTSVARPPSTAMLFATLAAPPSRRCSDSNRTTGTGASGEMRVTRPTMKRSSMTSPTMRIGRPEKRPISCWARSAWRDGRGSKYEVRSQKYERQTAESGCEKSYFILRTSSCVLRTSCFVGGEGERDDDQEQHQKLGVAEVVLEESRREHRGDRGECGG